MTVYPRSDSEFKELADELTDLTKGFHGPVVVSDLKLGDITYTRYGGFNPIITRDRLGQIFLSIHAPDGALRTDLQQVPFSHPDGVPNPFTNYSCANGKSPVQTSRAAPVVGMPSAPHKLFGPGYLVLEVIRHRPKGTVFRAIDLRAQDQVCIRVIKQGRQHCLTDEHGRDIRARLRHQEALHNALVGRVPIAKADPYFEVEGDGYLPLEDIAGQTIEFFTANTLKSCSWSSLTRADRLTLLVYSEQTVSAVQAMHTAGYVHRDLSASNIWIGADGRIYLLDLELAHAVNDMTPAFGLGTPGFMSPAQEAHEPPTYADDVYALGCVLILLVTGLDPRRVLFASEKHRVHQLMELTNGAPLGLIEKIARCTNADPSARPNLESIRATTKQYIRAGADNVLQFVDDGEPLVRNGTGRRLRKPLENEAYGKLISGAQQGLFDGAIRDEVSGLWLSAPSGHDSRVRPGSYHIHRDAHKGVAEIIYLLGRLARFGYGTEAWYRITSGRPVRWLLIADEFTERAIARPLFWRGRRRCSHRGSHSWLPY